MTKYEISCVETQKVPPCPIGRARSHLISVASRLGGGGLGLGDNDSLLVDGLEERPDDGTIGDLSTLKKTDQP